MKKGAFTLVELIVVITILAILATIGFVSFSGYLAGTRDTNRIAQLKSMSDALELYRSKKDLPIPDDKVDVQANGTTIAYQGYIGANVLETIEYTEKGLDPKDKTYFSYYLTKNKKYFQLLGFLEEANTDVVTSIFNNLQAVDYSGRYPHTQGRKLGVLTDATNTPIQEISVVTSSGYVDIVATTNIYNAHFSDTSVLSGTGSGLRFLSNVGSGIGGNCKILLAKDDSLKGKQDGYIIDPEGTNPFPVYCDMTTDGGGWTMIESFSLGNNITAGYQNHALSEDWERNPNEPDNFVDYRLSKNNIDVLNGDALEYRLGCNMVMSPTDDYAYIDKSDVDIINFLSTGTSSNNVREVSIRGNKHSNVGINLWQNPGAYHFVFSDDSALFPGGVDTSLFGYYVTTNPVVTCTANASSTTNYWVR